MDGVGDTVGVNTCVGVAVVSKEGVFDASDETVTVPDNVDVGVAEIEFVRDGELEGERLWVSVSDTDSVKLNVPRVGVATSDADEDTSALLLFESVLVPLIEFVVEISLLSLTVRVTDSSCEDE